MYMKFPVVFIYTETELRQIHRLFYHPATDKLTSLIQNGAPEHNKSESRKNLEHLRSTRDACRRSLLDSSRL